VEGVFFDSIPGWGTLLALSAALFIALGYEFINGFHDTANAVATVIYTRSMSPTRAVALSGLFNFLGVLTSGVGVAYSVVNLLPVEVLVGGRGGEFAVIFSVLFGALMWNLGTWYLGIPASSSHSLIGAIIGVGLTHSVVTPGLSFGQGVHWKAAYKVGISLLISPLVGFGVAFFALVLLKSLLKRPELYHPPVDPAAKPPGWIRGLLVTTCAGVSFAHGSNDGQKGMGLIMLILIGLAPFSFALNLQTRPGELEKIRISATQVQDILVDLSPSPSEVQLKEAPSILEGYLDGEPFSDQVVQAMAAETGQLQRRLGSITSFQQIPAEQRWQVRAQGMLLVRSLEKARTSQHLHPSPVQNEEMLALESELGLLIEYVSDWVKVAVAVALGLGTMVGWKRVVVTVGEKIGKSGLTYGQGLVAQTVTMGTILAGDGWGMPMSTTHILSSGVAGTMLANQSGLQQKTLANIALAWVLTLPATMGLSSLIYVALRQFI
jgi:PiT family inorganic phosphate transporter